MSCWGTLLGPSPQPHSHLVQHIGYGQATAQLLGAGTRRWDVERLQLWGRGKSNGQSQDLGPLSHYPFLDFSCHQKLHTVGLGLAWGWPVATASQLRGEVASAHLGPEGAWPHFTSVPQTPRDQARNLVTWSPKALRQQASSPVPLPHVTQPQRGGVSPVLSTQACHVMGAGVQARVQRPRQPTTPFLLPAPGPKNGPSQGRDSWAKKSGHTPVPGPAPNLPR